MRSWVRFGESVYPAPLAKIVCTHAEEGLVTEIYSFDPQKADPELFATQGGITINGITWRGTDQMDQLAGRRLDLSAEMEPELIESVFWQQGEALEIQKLSVSCTSVQDGMCELEITAVLANPDGEPVDASSTLYARVEMR